MDVERRRKKNLVERARRMRKNPTYAESKLWSRLKGKSLDGLKFRRQHVLPPYILDFYCTSKTLAVEVDGPHHKETTEQDQQRTQVLAEEHGVRVLRFTSWRVLNEIEDVLEEILEACVTCRVPGTLQTAPCAALRHSRQFGKPQVSDRHSTT